MTKINVESLRHHLLFKRPETREELATWVTNQTGLLLPRRTLCASHQTPLDYLADTFFEEGPTGDATVWACRGGGKTMIGALATLLDLVFKPGIQIRILGGSLEQSDRMYAYLRTFFEGPLRRALRSPPTRRKLALRNGSVVQLLAQSESSVRGTRVQKLRCDEIELFDREVWSAAQLTTRRSPSSEGPDVRGAIEALSTMHRPGGIMQGLFEAPPPGAAPAAPRRTYAWCIWDVIAKCSPKRDCATCPLWKDCGGRAKEAQGFVAIEDVIAMHGRVSRAVWEHEMLCFPPRFADAVFEGFRRKTHLRAWPLDRAPRPGESIICGPRTFTFETLIAGVDFGISAFVCLWIAMLRDASGRRVAWVLDELVTRNRTLPGNAVAMQNRPIRIVRPDDAPQLPGQAAAGTVDQDAAWQPSIVYCDVAGIARNSQTGQSDQSVLHRAGFNVKSSTMFVEEGIVMLTALVDPALEGEEAPRLLIDPRCTRLIAAMEGYRRRPDGKADKDGTHDHPIDALRYALVNHDRERIGVTTRKY